MVAEAAHQGGHDPGLAAGLHTSTTGSSRLKASSAELPPARSPAIEEAITPSTRQ